ncbi:toll/interleukin-1 receptor domain-containing protein [Streptomyces sp. SPB162]|uniref:toll/interleukin-1 receptor domain-containing protein n=1 Tax=Streptomyces sp. SPB162 TaxID=2940560 RepID=UPI0024072B65|nr:toll/interleukin-1 receptor domain-containing protein [Streptomyces sp. SPB162]MDF9811949.1 hypothetical protein [Streptomyces sp. SPB162]
MQDSRVEKVEKEPRAIFVSYRRMDSKPWSGRLVADLRTYFGKERVYFDLDSNRSAQDYIIQLERALLGSRAVVALIGPDWLNSSDGNGQRRLDDASDLVRLEIETALKNGIALVPVLVGGATMPSGSEMPRPLGTLARLQAVRLSDDDWPYDFGRLLETLERHAVLPIRDAKGNETAEVKVTKLRRYERTVKASRRRAFDALAGAVEMLHYPVVEVSPEAARVVFNARRGGVITGEVVDADPGSSMVVLKFPTVKNGIVAAGSLALAYSTGGWSLLVGPALWGWERRFAVGFFDNVEGVLEGRGVGEDSSLLPGIHAWRNRKREV